MPRARFAAAAVLLLAVHLAMLGVLAELTPWTVDEPNYLAAGLAIRNGFDFEAFSTILHGPLPFYGNQLLLPAGLEPDPAVLAGHKLASRLGMLPFAALAALALLGFARACFGERAALAALVLHATNPVVLGHGCLITADTALTAFWVLTAWMAWRWLRAPSVGRLVAAGAALGGALATKYLALFLLPALAGAAAVACLRGLRPGLVWSRREGAGAARRLLDLLPAGALCGGVALVVLHACYLGQADTYELRPPEYAADAIDPQDPEAGPLSASMRALVGVPGAAEALALLPEPFVRGVDYQKFYSERGGVSSFAGRIGPGFWDYFLVALATKLPLAFLVAVALGLALRSPPWPPRLGGLLGWLVLVPLVYLSLFTVLQIGVRYLLPILPLLALVAARALPALWPARSGRMLVGVLALGLVAQAAWHWPHYIGAFNPLAGDRPYLLFRDSNVAWRHQGWAPDRDAAEAARRHPESEPVFPLSGPRFGVVRAPLAALTTGDPRAPQRRIYHWLRRFEPLDRIGSWWVFDAREPAFRRAVGIGTAEEDPRGVVDLAIALVGEGRGGDALAALEGSSEPEAERVRAAARMVTAGRGHGPAWWQLLLELGRFDRIVAAGPEAPPLVRALAHFRRHEYVDARTILERLGAARPLDQSEAILLAFCMLAMGELEEAVETAREHAPPPGDPMHDAYRRRLRRLEDEVRALRLVERKAGARERDR